MQVNLGRIAFIFSWSTWWVRGRFGCYLLKMPWAPAFYSERYGHVWVRRFIGFRIIWRD